MMTLCGLDYDQCNIEDGHVGIKAMLVLGVHDRLAGPVKTRKEEDEMLGHEGSDQGQGIGGDNGCCRREGSWRGDEIGGI